MNSYGHLSGKERSNAFPPGGGFSPQTAANAAAGGAFQEIKRISGAPLPPGVQESLREVCSHED